MLNDEQLLIKAKSLDPVALRAIHQQFYEHVARYTHYKVSDPRTAEDLTGEVFVRVLESLKHGKGWQSSAKGWIMGIAHHVVVDYYRKHGRMQEVVLTDELTSSDKVDPLHQTLLNDRKDQLMTAINTLTDEQRDVIMMRFIEGLNIQAVAEAMNKTPGAIKALQYRAMRVLAEKLEHSTLAI